MDGGRTTRYDGFTCAARLTDSAKTRFMKPKASIVERIDGTLQLSADIQLLSQAQKPAEGGSLPKR